MRLYLVRHADTGIVERVQKPEDGLSKNGFEQARALAGRARFLDVSAIYSSPYQRALSTARVVARQFTALEIQTDERLKEIPLWVSPVDLRDDTQQEYSEVKELLDVAQSGVLEFLDELCVRYTEKNILVVAHGNLIRATVGVLLKMPLESVVRLTVNHASITTFGWVNDPILPFYLLHGFNDTAHLED